MRVFLLNDLAQYVRRAALAKGWLRPGDGPAEAQEALVAAAEQIGQVCARVERLRKGLSPTTQEAVNQEALRSAPDFAERRRIVSALVLTVLEVAEAITAVIEGGLTQRSTRCPALTALEEELADVLIRTVDLAADLKIDLDRAVHVKLTYNKTRPPRHGGKVI